MKMRYLFLILGLGLCTSAFAQSEYDDIYYNPQKDSKSSNFKGVTHGNSNYVEDMSLVDVDAYNRRGESYYLTPIDTIGTGVGNGEDFVYTQKIQKFYNPTIVVNNADLLNDIINNSYGNVQIVYENNNPIIVSGFGGYYPYYNNWWGPGWNISWNWGWGPSWSWSWGWGPSWSWNYPYNPWYAGYWGPGWGWGPAWGWGRPRDPYYAQHHWRPYGNGSVGPRPGWSHNTRPGYNGSHRGSSTVRPGSNMSVASRPEINAGHRPGAGNTTIRPGGGNSYTRPGSAVTTRPNNGGSTVRPNNGGASVRPGNSSVRPGMSATTITNTGRPNVNAGVTGTARPSNPNAGTSSRPMYNGGSYNRYNGNYNKGNTSNGSSTVRPSGNNNGGHRNSATQARPSNNNNNYQRNTTTTHRNNSYSAPANRGSYGGGYSGGRSGGGRSGGGGGRHR